MFAGETAAIESLPVRIHIYDVSHNTGIRRLNSVLAHRRSPVKFGGVFHAGVEVAGLEWCFGQCDVGTGIKVGLPRKHDDHHYRQTVTVAQRTSLSADEVASLIAQLKMEWPGCDYQDLRRNCCHFADEFCRRLGVGVLPAWVYRLARIGARAEGALRMTIPFRPSGMKAALACRPAGENADAGERHFGSVRV